MQWVLPGIPVVWVVVSGACVVACGGSTSTPGRGDVGSSGGTGPVDNVSWSGGTAGDESAMTHDPPPSRPVPEPPDDGCAPLKEVWAHIPPQPDGSICPLLSCPCDDGFFSYTAKRGCLVSVDCAAWCSTGGGCIEGYDECVNDADCSPGFCVKDAGQNMGECASGMPGARCRSDAHCPTGRCVAVSESGRRECTSAGNGATCNENADCNSGDCLLPAGTSFLGACTDRASGSSCQMDKDCVAGLTCMGAEGTRLGMCAAFR